MIHMQKILFPTDFSDTTSAALGHALMLADRFHAELIMLHAAPAHEKPQDIRFPEIYPAADELQETLEDQLVQIFGVEPAHKLRLQRVVHQNNNPTQEICAFAETQQIDLIIMGTHGRSGLSHLFAGSVAEEVVRKANCPVMTVRAGKKAAEVSPYFDILVPIDFSLHSQKALRYGRTLALLFDATLHLLHVLDKPILPSHYGLGEDSLMQLHPEAPHRSREEMLRLLEQWGSVRVKHQIHLREGRAYHEIVDFAAKQQVDLLVMGTHGLSGLEHFLLGGTTEKVMRHVSCPVLAVKMQERDFVG